jgi:hypothetical protein
MVDFFDRFCWRMGAPAGSPLAFAAKGICLPCFLRMRVRQIHPARNLGRRKFGIQFGDDRPLLRRPPPEFCVRRPSPLTNPFLHLLEFARRWK